MVNSNTFRASSATMMLAACVLFVISRAGAQHFYMPPLPHGYVYQVISITNAGDGRYLTADQLGLPPLPPDLVFGIMLQPTNSVEVVPELFETSRDQSPATTSFDETGIKRRRLTRLNLGWSSSSAGKFVANFFEDASYTAVVERTEPVGSSIVRVCRLESKPQSRLIIAEQEGVIAASLILPGENWYTTRSDGAGLQIVTELQRSVPKSAKPECVVDVRVPAKGEKLSDGYGERPSLGPESMQAPVIDILVVYTPATTASQGGPVGISTLISLSVAEVNEVFANSLINARLRLIHKQQVQYVESGDFNLQTDYDRLKAEMDGFLDEVPPLAEAWGADLVSLWVTHPNALQSRGEVMTQTSTSKYSVVIARYAASTGTPDQWHFAHELGHNLGCDHSIQSNSGLALRWANDSLGNWQICAPPCGPDGDFTDIMASPLGALPYYSNPQVLYTDPMIPNPCPTGFSSPCGCDCAGTINETALIVAGQETATVLLLPTFHSDTQRFSFEIAGPPNKQCKIESSSDLTQWTLYQVITLSASGTGSFSDNGVGTVPFRFYRVTP